MKKLAALIETEECDVETGGIKSVSENKAVTLIKKVDNCKPFIGVFYLSVF